MANSAGVGGMGVDHFPSQFKYRHKLYRILRRRAAQIIGYTYMDLNKDFIVTEASSRMIEKGAKIDKRENISVVIFQRIDDRGFSEGALIAMADMIQKTYVNVSVHVRQLDAGSLDEQAVLMQEASLVIAVDGAAVDNALFMPECTGLLVVGRDVNRPASFDLSHGFLMHETHFQLWQQWLAIELIE